MATAQIVDMTDEEYFSIEDRCSASTIKGDFRKSPAHYKAKKDKETPSLSFGSIAHKAILEPSTFRDKYIVSEKFDLRTKKGKEDKAIFEGMRGDRETISQDDHKKVLGMKQAFAKNGMATRFIKTDGPIEKVVLFEFFGIPFKAKLDKIAPKFNTIIDYKTSQSADPEKFKYDYLKYGYHIQGYVYLMAAQAAGYDVEKVTFIVQEKEAPYAVNIFNLSQDALFLAENEVMGLAPKWWECYKTDTWQPYPETITELDLTYTARNQLEQSTIDSLTF